MADVTERAFEEAQTQMRALADRIAGVVAGGAASLVVTGGQTVGPLYDELAPRRLPWERLDITLCDERWVPPDHADSNERLVRERLLQGPAAAARFTPLKTPDPTPEAALSKLEAAVAALPRPFDAVLIGMGEDGHVASLFPGDASSVALDAEGARLVVPGSAPGGMRRISLTARALLDTRLLVVLIRGEAKRAVMHQAMERRLPERPVGALLRQARCPVEVYWSP